MIIVFGGTFNPVTIAHEKIVLKIKEEFNPKKVIILPTGDSYTWKKDFVSFSHRFEMLKLSFKDELFVVSDLENNEDFKGTYQSLLELKRKYNEEIYFLLGADNLLYINKWINYEKIIKEFKLIVVKRDNISISKYIRNNFPNEKDNFKIISFNMPLSSSIFRSNPKEKSLVNKEVYDYIVRNNLYGVNDDV